jgi:transcriptional regulator with XRE-family HTH domain
MNSVIGNKIERLRRSLGLNQEQFAELIGSTQASVSRWEKGGAIRPAAQEKIAMRAGMTVHEFFFTDAEPRLIPIVGDIAFEDGFDVFDKIDDPSPIIEHIRLSIGDPEHQIAIRIQTDKLVPAYRAGDVVIGTKLFGEAIKGAIGRDCIVQTADGRGFVRVVQAGAEDDLYNLRSFNHQSPDERDVDLAWAAPISWITRPR